MNKAAFSWSTKLGW